MFGSSREQKNWERNTQDSYENWENIANSFKSKQKTSLKIFKHYKLKPSFSIIKDEKAMDKVGVGDKPPPPSFNNLIKFDPIWSNLIKFEPSWSNLIQFDQVWSNLFQSDPIWSNLIQFDPIWSCFNQIINLMQFEAI